KKENPIDIAQTRSAAGGRSVGFESSVGHDVGIRSNVRIPETGLVTQTLHDCERMRCEIMLRLSVACVGPSEQYLPRPWGSAPPTASTAASALGGWSLGEREAKNNEEQSKRKNQSFHDDLVQLRLMSAESAVIDRR